jgi:uncharacterized protein (TIGR03435 family)
LAHIKAGPTRTTGTGFDVMIDRLPGELGLELKQERGPGRVLVVDSVLRDPHEN